MATTVSVAGSSYSVPQEGDSSWGNDVTNLLIQLATSTKVLQITSSSFPLNQDLSFGVSYGLKTAYIKSQAVNPSGSGILRLGSAESVAWRNTANSADLSLAINGSDRLQFGGVVLATAGVASIVNADVSPSAAIAYSKLNLTGAIVNADVNASAAIAYSKLNLATSIVNADINASAAIALSKLASLTVSRATQTNASTGILEASAVTNTELSYLSGATSSLQTQLNAAVTLTGIQTITNKTLTAPVISGGTIDNATIGATTPSTVRATSVSVTGTAGAGFLDQSVQSAAPSTPASGFRLFADAIGRYAWKRSNGRTVTYDASSLTADQIYTLPDATTTIVGTDATQTLTNKTLTSPLVNTANIDGGTASNTSRITLPKAAKTVLDALTRKQGTIAFDTTSGKPYYDDGTALQLIGSGSGGSVNFVTNPDAEAGATGYVVDSFAAATRPSGALTGISTGVTFTASATAPLSGTNSFIFSKDAADRQGRVVYTGITITPAYFAKVLQINVDYLVDSGTFVSGSSATDSDVIFYLQNVTDGTFIEPSSFKPLSNSTTIADKFSGTFQTASAATSYRLLMYVASNSALAYSLKLDNISVSPSVYVYGSPITDWQSYSLAITGAGSNPTFGTIATNKAFWRRAGDSVEIQFSYYQTTAGTAGGGTYRFSLPPGLSIDTAKTNAGVSAADPNQSVVGIAQVYANSITKGSVGSVFIQTTTQLGIAVSNDVNAHTALGSAFLTFAEVGYTINFTARVPILGWSSSVQMSDQTDTRIVDFTGSITGLAVTASVTNITAAAIKDSHSAWTGSTYVVKVPGDYNISAFSYSVATAVTLLVFINGVVYKYLSTSPANTGGSGSLLLPDLKTGDIVSLRSLQTATIATDTAQHISISRLSGSATISATESINARYKTSAGQSIPTTQATIVWGTKDYDTHGGMDVATGIYTVPVSGKYEVICNITLASAVNTLNSRRIVNFRKNNVTTFAEAYSVVQATYTGTFGQTASTTFDCVAGDNIRTHFGHEESTARSLLSNGMQNWISIKRIGN